MRPGAGGIETGCKLGDWNLGLQWIVSETLRNQDVNIRHFVNKNPYIKRTGTRTSKGNWGCIVLDGMKPN